MTTIANSSSKKRHWAQYGRNYYLILVACVALYTTIASFGVVVNSKYAPDLFFQPTNTAYNKQPLLPMPDSEADDVTIATSAPNMYVCFSTTLDAFARESDYDFLVPLTAQNWHKHGFIPIIMVVGSSLQRITATHQMWQMLLPMGTIVIPVVVPPQHQVPVAQLIRHYAATLVMPQLDDEAYIRITDADMMILDRQPFLRPLPSIDIDIYNGNCCRAILYPMHSIGMTVSLWRELLYDPALLKNKKTQVDMIESVVSNIQRMVLNSTGYNNLTQAITHGGEGWYLDQEFIRKAIDGAVRKKGYVLNLGEGPGPRRRHIGEQFKWNFTIDVHLTRFKLSSDIPWLETFLIESGSIGGLDNWGKYAAYRDTWMRYKLEQNITKNNILPL